MTANYVQFGDDGKTLKKNGDLDFDFDFNISDVDTTQNASVEFLVQPTGDAHLTVKINDDTVVDQQHFGVDVGRVWRENFLGGSLKPNDTNTLTVVKNDDGEDITVSDFIIHFKTA